MSASPVLKTKLTITLHPAFPEITAEDKDNFVVMITNKNPDPNPLYGATNEAEIKIVNILPDEKKLELLFPGAWMGTYTISVTHATLGKLDTANLSDFQVEAKVTSFTPNSGSILGGTLITITGTNFGDDPQDNPVHINLGEYASHVKCLIISTSATKITCRVEESEFAQRRIQTRLEAGANPELVVFLKASEEAKCDDCSYTFIEESNLPTVTKITSEFEASGDKHVIKVKGTQFTGDSSSTELYVGGLKQQTDSVSSTEAIFTIIDLKLNSDFKNKLKVYFGAGLPSGQATVSSGVTVGRYFSKVTPNVGSIGGTTFTATVLGLGRQDGSLGIMGLEQSESICQTARIETYSKLRCTTTKDAAIAKAALRLKQGSTFQSCENSDGSLCEYETAAQGMPTVLSATISADKT